MIKTLLFGLTLLIIERTDAQTDSTAATPLVVDSTTQLTRDTIPVLSFGNNNASIKSQPVYKLKPIVDVPLTMANAAWTLYAFTKIYSKPSTDPEVVLGLNKNDINWFDRWAVRPYSPSLDKLAYK